MRDNATLKADRDHEPDPYARKFPFPKWTRTVTVLDEYRLFNRLPEFAGWSRTQHVMASEDYLSAYLAHARALAYATAAYTLTYKEGVWMAGAFCAHWPTHAQDVCRTLARTSANYADRSLAHWRASRRTAARWRTRRDLFVGRQ